MKSSRFRRRAGWSLVGLSLLLHILTVYAFSRQPEFLAAYTVMPIWVWGGIGLLLSIVAFWFLRAPLSLILTGIWAITVLLGADEARVIANLGKSAPEPGQAGVADGKFLVRVLTLNCKHFNYAPNSDPSLDIQRWDPDIVLLQEVEPIQVKRVADRLYQGHGDYRTFMSNGIVTRWRISREVRNQLYRDQQVTVMKQPEGAAIEVVNVHLEKASTDLRLWNPDCWYNHRVNRKVRAVELWHTLQVLADTASGRPAIVGGDFNAPPSDPIQSLMKGNFDDAFVQAGTGWGDTYQRRIPILRIDQIHSTRQLRPIRCSAVTTRHSDHRMVVADFLMVP
ncbi:endonuclease/exonuclease/phosphatase family protein [Haloferula sp. BvORR071]|uniref:endonuclease/exonuclease/phosphatase family protein n=1 Tax=Haloferula sp. BvORR071 TaxID=1396141 RepID=UPI000551AD45|nr:endonuclease/exonuclease/phosphatase family protein [Haloferula sp. BvORR071]